MKRIELTKNIANEGHLCEFGSKHLYQNSVSNLKWTLTCGEKCLT